MNEPCILVVDDEPDIRTLVQEILEDEGYTVDVAATVMEAREQRRRRRFDLILLDIWMPDGDGISLLKEWSEAEGQPSPVVMMSGHGSVETAVEATRLGAYDFLEKPLSMAKLTLTVERALEADRLTRENIGLRRRFGTVIQPEGSSPVMQALREQVLRIAQHDTWVLISGEAGVGKQTFARFLHSHSARSAGPFVDVPVGTMNAAEAAVELFGEEEGNRVRYGLLEQAEGGVLYLDEVAQMDPHTQGRLLTALENRRMTRIGGRDAIAVNVRVVAATREDLRALVHAGGFREDLYYRLSVVPLHIPPLREHPQDIPELLRHQVEALHQEEGLPRRHFSEAACALLARYPWPGNIRELRNLVQRLLILGNTEEVDAAEAQTALSGRSPRTGDPLQRERSVDMALPLREAREQFERDYLLRQMAQVDGHMTRLAERVGLERTHLYRKLRALGIEPRKAKESTTPD
ncbi:DNA-binding transcriptional response regulator, NtrC family, contains REC, AAA-type ATPase, and a Fis-type DNA-binding domains [Ectothiorhodospira magna]|uniref:DNA-binding transcriptional response regulator, NtrC family, contains REC, AAA-type ATPase, and a Fis-type DNA-binding domains n=1 Tax=Ectothiorhodospira magna TaxID=867345 RepID=A0A1H9FIZ8_9GAMM|nr:sigma-54 dependent transcriptional regulator [Ectothiorhodospira magna]SEQ37755.1 DNA-binding transcriptional response regulator, NtrC family, contains REC, AAA-type ATPase, and a Fis-type DNA-binding domains [Ectothiorhodospira magna]